MQYLRAQSFGFLLSKIKGRNKQAFHKLFKYCQRKNKYIVDIFDSYTKVLWLSIKFLSFQDNLFFHRYGRFSIRMDFYDDQNYQSKFSWSDFPVEVAYRQRLYFEVSIATLDQSLQVMAGNCCSTPTADHNKEHRFRHEMIHEG